MAQKGTLKSILSIGLAVVIAYVLVKIFFYLLGFLLKGILFLLFIIAIAIIALPIYTILKKKVFK
jgi:hypothetical protein